MIKHPKSAGTMGSKRQRSLCRKPLHILAFFCAAVLIGSAFVYRDCREKLASRNLLDVFRRTNSNSCEEQCRPMGTEALPRGIVARYSDLEMRPLWGAPTKRAASNMNLLAMAVGKKQKANVDEIARKFLSSNSVVMLFHYDGNVDDWKDLEWSARALHVAAANQTKWWFAKRFLHPDIVADYSYIFLWDEDLGVEYFNVQRYVSVIRKEGLEISQPALDPENSQIHHQITARQKGPQMHRRIIKILPSSKRKCDENSTEPPCTGWVEMMAPVFSRDSWRCVWHMIQNDLVHAWGLDYELGYCAQGDRTKNVGIVDSDYVIHRGLPTLMDAAGNTTTSTPNGPDVKAEVKKQQSTDQNRFKNRWRSAIKRDECWTDPYHQPLKEKS